MTARLKVVYLFYKVVPLSCSIIWMFFFCLLSLPDEFTILLSGDGEVGFQSEFIKRSLYIYLPIAVFVDLCITLFLAQNSEHKIKSILPGQTLLAQTFSEQNRAFVIIFIAYLCTIVAGVKIAHKPGSSWVLFFMLLMLIIVKTAGYSRLNIRHIMTMDIS